MRVSKSVAAACPAALLLSVLAAAPAAAAPVPDYEAPFVCGQEWVGSTRSGHSPSYYSVDFNRADDLGQLVVSTAPGVVSRVTDTGSSSYGKYIIVDHGGGDTSLYAHLLAQYVTTGQRVDQGTILGLLGTSGGSTGPHLHFEQRLWSRVQRPYFHQEAYTFGRALTSRNCPDVPLAGNWDGRGSDEVGVFRRGLGKGIFRMSRADTNPLRTEFGYSADHPLVGDWDGDGVTELGVWSPALSRFRMRVTPKDVRVTKLGNPGSLPVTGDWNGDGLTDIGVFDPSTRKFTLRTRPIGPPATTITFGKSTDLPVTGDWNGDGRTDIGTWSPSTATYSKRVPTRPNASTATVTTQKFGLPRVR